MSQSAKRVQAAETEFEDSTTEQERLPETEPQAVKGKVKKTRAAVVIEQYIDQYLDDES